MKDISVIVPVYNVKNELRSCLDSLLNQTMQNIEIICIDDASQDGCIDILKEYEEKDSRIINIFHKCNLGTSQGRKDGVLASHGKYIMFLDGDDSLTSDACEVAYHAIEQNRTDIVQFDVNIINCADVPEGRIKSNQKALAPYIEHLTDINLIRACWEDKKFNFNLWNKIYNGDLCRKAFSYVEDGHFPRAQDLYAFFIIAYFAKSSSGIENVLYNYSFGIGVTGGTYLSLEKFKILLTEYKVYKAIESFLINQNAADRYQDILQTIYHHFLNECVGKWKNNVKPEYLSVGFHEMVRVWGYEDIFCMLAERNWYDGSQIAEKMLDVDYFNHKKRPEHQTLTLAAYYRSISNGGAQRVVTTLCNIWASMKNPDGSPLYRVVLITDAQPEENEYELDEAIERAYLPDFENAIKENYRERFEAWNKILSKFDVDIVISSMWVATSTLWDMLCVKGHESKPAFIIHAHSFCCIPYSFYGSKALELTYTYQLCDGVVTLSECDRRFAAAFSSNTKCIVNPITFHPENISISNYENHTLVWVGRISKEKRPQDAVYMMEYVVREIPDAKLYIVGDGDEKIYSCLQELIEKLHLGDNIILVGFSENVDEYYKKAMVFIGTSEYEGFSLTFCEAMSHAVPIVSYDMPWLTFMQDGRGIVPVKMKRTDELARAVITLLQNPEHCKEIGLAGKAQIIEMDKIDIGEEWKTIFNHIDCIKKDYNINVNEAIIYKYLSIYQQIGKNNIRNSLNKKLQDTYAEKSEINRKLQITYGEKFERGQRIKILEKQLNKVQKEKEAIENSTTFKIGKIVMYFPILIKNFIKRKK